MSLFKLLGHDYSDIPEDAMGYIETLEEQNKQLQRLISFFEEQNRSLRETIGQLTK